MTSQLGTELRHLADDVDPGRLPARPRIGARRAAIGADPVVGADRQRGADPPAIAARLHR